MAELKCPHCGETRDSNIDYDWLAYHEQDCEVTTLRAKVESTRAAWEAEQAVWARDERALQSKLDSIRRETIQECWDAINKHIEPGTIGGNGCDRTAQRNGLILATNILHMKLEPPK